jgi:hypothetical protein
MLPTKFRFIWPNGFREEFLKSANQKQELPVVAIFVNGSGRNEQSLQRNHRCFLSSFGSFGQADSEKIFLNLYRDNCNLNTDIYIQTRVIFLLTENIFKKSTNQKQELPVTAMFVNQLGQNEQFL